MTTQRRYRCIFCGAALPGWLPMPKRPDGVMLLGYLKQHPDQIGPCLERMRNEDIAMVAA
jgi:hypothetical protein